MQYFGIMELLGTGDFLNVILLPYLHTYGTVFWLALWVVLMIVLYVKMGDLTAIILLSTIMLGAVTVYKSPYDFFPVQAVSFGVAVICLISAGILYRFYSKMR